MFVTVANNAKSLSALRQQLVQIEDLENGAIDAVTDAIAAYQGASLGAEYWEGFLNRLLDCFPTAVVKKQPLLDQDLTSEDLKENLAALERELATKTQNLRMVEEERDELREGLTEWELKGNQLANNLNAALFTKGNEIIALTVERDELRKQLTEWESKGNQLANELIESSTEDRKDSEAEIEKLTREIEVLKNERGMIIEGYEKRVQFFETEINRYRELEQSWGKTFTALQEEAKRNKEIAAQLNEELAKLNVDALASQSEKKSETYCELVELSPNVGYLKVTETGEILAAYAGFNVVKREDGTRILGKTLGKEWERHLSILNEVGGNKGNLTFELRKGKRLKCDWELKITGLTMGQIEKLAKEDLTASPKPVERNPFTPKLELKQVEDFDPQSPEFKIVFAGSIAGRIWLTRRTINGEVKRGWRHSNQSREDETLFPTSEEATKACIDAPYVGTYKKDEPEEMPEF